MALTNYDFSDLLFSSEGDAFLKGCPGFGQGLMPLPDDCNLSGLKEKIQTEFIKRITNRDDGSRDIPMSLRIEFQDIQFRVADIKDINNEQTWFLRRIPSKVSTLAEIGFPQNFVDWLLESKQNQGLILLTGSQASGKTTVASTLFAQRLAKYGGHGITFEYPPEFPLHGKHGERGKCYQTEINGERELASHIERAYRYASPNIIYIGEIRTKYAATEVLRMALSSSEQLIIATLHGQDIISALERLKNWAIEIEGTNAVQNLADSLLAVFHTNLEITEDKKVLHIPEFILVPFDNDESLPIRNKIRENKFLGLKDIMREQKNRIKFSPQSKITF